MTASTKQQHPGLDCSGARRNRYYRGKQMKAEEFQAEQDYGLQRRRLVNRTVLGWGVVQGLGLDDAGRTGHPAVLKVQPGMALDRHGREIVLPGEVTLDVSNLVLLKPAGDGCGLSPHPVAEAGDGRHLLCVHYAERAVGDVELPDGCGCGRVEKRFVCETVLFTLRAPQDAAGLGGEPGCRREHACGPVAASSPADRGPHETLCRWVEQGEPAGDAGRLPAWHDGLCLDPHAGVALGWVDVRRTQDRCAPVSLVLLDSCGPRRLVKNNDLLHDLVRGCDLTTIHSISWADWHRRTEPVTYDDFMARFNPSRDVPPKTWCEPVATSLEIRFSRPVLANTLLPDAFSLRFLVHGVDTGWRDLREVPVAWVEPLEEKVIGPLKTARGARLHVPPEWVREVEDPECVLEHDGATVEILVHGDFILDRMGQPIDANARGCALRHGHGCSGNGVPGGTFRSVFHVLSIKPGS